MAEEAGSPSPRCCSGGSNGCTDSSVAVEQEAVGSGKHQTESSAE